MSDKFEDGRQSLYRIRCREKETKYTPGTGNMTLIVASQFGDRIITYSDTMISNKSTGNNILPGRLKSIVINGELSISYSSNNADAALDTIRKVRRIFLIDRNLKTTVDVLAANSFDSEFIVVSHLPAPNLLKITNGKISNGASRYWIGNPAPIRRLAELETSLPVPNGYIPNNVCSPEEDAFRRAIHHLLSDPVEHSTNSVGGFLIEQLGSPYGHCYGGSTMVKWFDTIELPQGLTAQQQADRASGMTMFGYSTLSSERGAPVLGIFLDQIGLGYIYRPTESDDPEKIYPCKLSQLSGLVRKYARRMGGFLNE